MYFPKALIVLCVFSQGLFCVHGVNYPSGGDGNGTAQNPKFGLLEDVDLVIDLDGNATGGFEDWNFITGPFELGTSISAGSLSPITGNLTSGFQITFYPKDHFEGNATFDVNSSVTGTGFKVTHTFTIEMTGANDAPRLKFRDAANVSEVFNGPASYSVAENNRLVGHVYGDELDAGDIVTLSLPANVLDNNRFEIPAGTNQIRFQGETGADYETPFSVVGNNVYQIRARGQDANETVEQTLTITITNSDEPPTTQPSGSINFTISEDKIDNQFGSFYLASKVGVSYFSLLGADPDGDDINPVKWSLSTVPSKGRVYYSTSDVALPMGTANELTNASLVQNARIWIDYHPDGNATTENGNETFTLRAEDQNNAALFSEFTVNVTINPENDDTPVWAPSAQPGGVYEYSILETNSTQVIVGLVATDADISDSLTYSVFGGVDASSFTIDPGNGQLRFSTAKDYESKSDSGGDDIFNVIVRVTDGTYNVDLPVIVTLVDVNEQPQVQELANFTSTIAVVEGNTWTIPANFLSGSDIDFGPNGKTGGLFSVDDDNNTLTWSTHSNPSQGGSISWTNASGAIPNFSYTPENSSVTQFPDSNLTQNESFSIRVEDLNGSSVVKNFTASVSPVPDPPLIWKFQRDGVATDITNYTSSQRLSFQYPENSSAATPIKVFVREYDGEPVVFSLLSDGTTDADNFTLTDQNSTASPYQAQLSFKNSFVPDFENPTDSGNDNNFSIKISVQDGNSSDYQYVDIIITDQQEEPIIVSPSVADPDSLLSTLTDFNVSIDENSLFVTNLQFIDPDIADIGAPVTWLKTGGTDQTKFEVNATTGRLSFRSDFFPNFENPLDTDRDNTYSVSFRVRESGSSMMSDPKTIHVKIRDINDYPTISAIPLDIDEPLTTNGKLNLAQYANDDDNESGAPDLLSWTERSGATSVFALDANGSLRFNQPSDFEANQTSFTLEVRVSDGRGGFADANFTVDVNAQNEAPEFFNELNQTISYLSLVTFEEIQVSSDLRLFAKDPESDPITFSTTYDDSNGTHTLNQNTGFFTFTPKANYSGITYIDILVTDGTNSATFPIDITITEVPDPPVVYQTGTAIQLGYPNTFLRSIFENNGTLVADLNASDPNDNPSSTNFIWTLSGTDASQFTMDPSQGSVSQLKFLQVPNFEIPTDVGGNNIYDFNMTIQDDGNFTVVPVRVAVIDGAEDPYFDYGDGNQTVTFLEQASGTVFDVNVSDFENSPITYGLTGNGPDDANFSINSITGVVTFQSPPDYESPWGGSDSNTTNTYILEVNATDDVATPSKIKHFVIVNVINVIEAPQFQGTGFIAVGSILNINIWENYNGQGNQYDINVTTEDVNQSLILEISGGADAGKFLLNVATNNLYWSNPNGQDFENPSSSDGDNSYEVQLRIAGTNVTQDFAYTVTDRNDAPTISTTGLTQLTLNENVPLAIDIDVLDQDGGGEFPDILYTVESSSTRFIEHNSSGLSVANLFKNPSSGMVDNSLPGATFSTAGDLNNDGDLDIITLSTSAIYYHEGNGTGLFESNTSTVIDDNVSGVPNHVIICDLDQDGDQDLLVCQFDGSRVMFYENSDPVGTFESPVALVQDRVGGGADFISVGDMDGDFDLDLIVAYQSTDEVVWYANDGATNFSVGGVVASSANGLDEPRNLELFDANSSISIGNRFQSPDILIAAKGGIYFAANNGKGIFSVSKIIDIGSNLGLVVRAVNLDGNQWPDFVYATSATGPPSYLLQGSSGFATASLALPNNTTNASWTIDTPTAVEIYTGPSIPPPNYSGPTPTTPAIIVSDSALPYMSIFTTSPNQNTGVQVSDPVVLNVPTGISSIMLADLNRQPDLITYSFDGGSDVGEFNATRFKDEGMLFFNSPYPNYEQPTDSSRINRYKVWVKAEDPTGLIAKELVTVKILDVNEPPVITTLDGNETSIIEHVENLTAVIDVNVTHEENATQTVTFSLVGGADQAKFDIVSETGELSFKIAPDFEANASSDNNNTYKVSIRATDNGVGAAFDEQHIQVRVVDGSEPPEFSSTVLTNRTVVEDGSIPLVIGVDINATDPNSSPGSGIGQYRVLTNGNDGNATIIGNTFSYTPDGNFTGTDVVVLEVNNTAGLKDTLTLNIIVTAFDDPPAIQTPAVINHPENLGHVIALSAVDDNNVTLNWSWGGGAATDSQFLLTSDGNLTFREVPNYEDAKNNNTYSKVIQVSDGVSTVDRNFTINVYNLNDNPPLSTFLTANASSSFSLVENNSIVVDLNASDADNSIVSNFNTITYSITGGADKLRFDVSNAGRLQLLPAPDYENPNSNDLDNIYMVELTLSDGGFSQVYPIVVTVTDADENNPTITSNGGLGTASHTHPENQLAVLQVVATDFEPKPLVYSISGGSDPNLFTVDSSSGQLNFITAPDYELPSDGDGNNLYEVWVRATDEGNTSDEQRINITVTDVDELPSVSPSLFSTTEDVAIPVNFTVADPEGGTATFLVITAPLYGTWTGSGNNFTYTPDANYHGSDSVTLRVSDGTSQFDTLVNIEVIAANDPPTAVNDEFFYNDLNFGTLGLDVLANDSNAPDQNGTETLSISSFSQPIDGNVSLALGASSLSFTPSTSFIGITTFNYTVSDGLLESNGTVEIVVSRASSLPSWRFLKKFGFYNQTSQDWIYHNDLGWLYLDDIAGVETYTWMWHEDMGWFWTGNTYFPDLYLNDLARWMSWKGTRTTGNTWTIYDQVDKQWLDSEKFKVARLNTVFSKLKSVDQVMDFVNSSPLFTVEERKIISSEFFFRGKSSTLESKGFTLAF